MMRRSKVVQQQHDAAEHTQGPDTELELKPPGWLLLALEGRAPWEWGASLLAAPILRNAPSGDGHPVLVFPGLVAGDFSTLVLRNYIARRGYAAYTWEQGLNLGPRPGLVEVCVKRVQRLRAEHDQPVSLVGWSLGGIYAREIAKMIPADVRQVITLGTPFAGSPKATNAWRIYELVSRQRVADAAQVWQLRKTPPVPTTSIYSRTDGVVAWRCSVERETDRSENIEVHASHIGLGLNPSALYAIADRLAQPHGSWQRFDRDGLQGLKKLLYRSAHKR